MKIFIIFISLFRKYMIITSNCEIIGNKLSKSDLSLLYNTSRDEVYDLNLSKPFFISSKPS